MTLKEWAVQFVRRRAAAQGGSLAETPDGARLSAKGATQVFVVRDRLGPDVMDLAPAEPTVVVCEYSEPNFEFVAAHFERLAAQTQLSFLFVHESGHETWRIKPALHAKFADPATLRQGLRASFDAVVGKGV